MIGRKQVVERGHQAFHMARTLTYLGEYKLLYAFTSLFRPWVELPEFKRDPALRPLLLRDIEELFSADARLFSDHALPWRILLPEAPWAHARRYLDILFAGVQLAHQRKQKRTRPQQEAQAGLPDYFVRNFHWQLDGYLSAQSAKVYDHQVEILFTGTAGAMRRLALPPMLEFLGSRPGARVLEVAAGTGEFALCVLQALPHIQLTVSDLSPAYLAEAQTKLAAANAQATCLPAAAEKLPLPTASQDLVYMVFLLHELPNDVRQVALQEALRVLRPGGRLVLVDSIQLNDVPEYNEMLEKFPQDYHEPFYRGYTQTQLSQLLREVGFGGVAERRGFLSKAVWADKPS